MLTGVLIICGELILLIAVALPCLIDFGERKFTDFYGDPFDKPHGDVPNLKSLFHDGSNAR